MSSSIEESTAADEAFSPPDVKVGDVVTYYSSWPRQERFDSKYQAWVTRVKPGGILDLWFPTVNGQRFPESIMHIDDPMLAEMPERWQEGGWTLGPQAQRIVDLEAELDAVREEFAAQIAEVEAIIDDVLRNRMERAAQTLANRRAGAAKAQAKRKQNALARRAAAGRIPSAEVHEDEEANS